MNPASRGFQKISFGWNSPVRCILLAALRKVWRRVWQGWGRMRLRRSCILVAFPMAAYLPISMLI